MSYDKFFFGDVARELYDFFWADLLIGILKQVNPGSINLEVIRLH
ncbi:hypothetical protein CASFOL_000812 [Castilleja foliolosa]|uniref:Uncharacterized protein n=1 Tax=Castilleja foliolosa TaxID=1961234 RepID=A0ABD3ELB0_9LAMI